MTSVFDKKRVFMSPTLDPAVAKSLTAQLRKNGAVVPRVYSDSIDYVIGHYADGVLAGIVDFYTPLFVEDHLSSTKLSIVDSKHKDTGNAAASVATSLKRSPSDVDDVKPLPKRTRTAVPTTTNVVDIKAEESEEEVKPKAKATKAKGKKAKDDEDVDDVKPKAKGKKVKDEADVDDVKPKGTKAKEGKDEEEGTNGGTLGIPPVDEYFPLNGYSVAQCPDDGMYYDFMLNQTNVGNNNNKFFLIQICKSATNWVFFSRWGRVGAKGQSDYKIQYKLEDAVAHGEAKFKAKSKFSFQDVKDGSAHGVVLSGAYTYLQRDFRSKNKEEDKNTTVPAVYPDSKLNPTVKQLVETIVNKDTIRKDLKSIGVDIDKMSLSNISKSIVKKGHEVLTKLNDVIISTKKVANKHEHIVQYTNEFYTLIPHYFGMRVPSLIQTAEQIKEKIDMLESLGELASSIKILEVQDQVKHEHHPTDEQYEKLKCQLEPLDKESDLFKKLCKYVEETHGSTHHTKLNVQEIFAVDREGEEAKFAPHVQDDNKQLLWHGSRLTNFTGILSQGLRIAPKEAPVTGYMFGKGVYFADMVTKSAGYCTTGLKAGTNEAVSCMLLCEVALGTCNELLVSDYNASNLPNGKHSTKGVGRSYPSTHYTLTSEQINVKKPLTDMKTEHTPIKIPQGPIQQADLKGGYLQYNEFIVYDIDRIKMKYLFMMKSK